MDKATSFYEIAIGLTLKPGSVMQQTGGYFQAPPAVMYQAAERLFGEAVNTGPTLFTAKNNLILRPWRAARVQPAAIEIGPENPPGGKKRCAVALHIRFALSAIKKGDVERAKGLLRDANPAPTRQHFEAAVPVPARTRKRSLARGDAPAMRAFVFTLRAARLRLYDLYEFSPLCGFTKTSR